jgi:homoserine kinase type II
MAVFTPLNPTDVQQWLRTYELGDLLGLEGISSGIENTNFFLDTSKGRFVLTLFERLSASDLPFYLELMRHLAARGIPCPDPIANRQGALLGELKAKPAAIVTRLSGHVQMQPDTALCAELGATLARMHLAAADYPGRLPNPRGRDWWLQTAPRVLPFLTGAQADLLQDELSARVRHLQRYPDPQSMRICFAIMSWCVRMRARGPGWAASSTFILQASTAGFTTLPSPSMTGASTTTMPA